MSNSPVVIFGSGRSGTTILSSLFERMGIFMGLRKDTNQEATFFLGLNSWIYKQAGGRWDQPKAVEDLRKSKFHREMTVDYLSRILDSPRVVEYMGFKKYIKYRNLSDLDFMWGWKDPRNTFTLPFWMQVFPELRAVHIRRHGVDVAKSFQVREKERAKEGLQWYRKRPDILNLVLLKRSGFGGSQRCVRLNGAFDLWEEYINMGDSLSKKYPDRVIDIKFENLVRHTHDTLKKVCKFLDPSGWKSRMISDVSDVNESRAYSYVGHPELEKLSQKNHPLSTFMVTKITLNK